MEAENAPNHISESPPEASEDNGNFLRGFSESRRLSDVAPASPSQHSLDLDQGQHMPHLLCSYPLVGFKLPGL